MEIATGTLVVAVVPLIAAVLAGLVVYWLSGRRAQKEWRVEKQAEVIAELYRLVSRVQATAGLATLAGVQPTVSARRIQENRKALEELSYYLHGHTLWIDARSAVPIRDFIGRLSPALKQYEAELNKGAPNSALALQAAEYVQRLLPEAERLLEDEFRAIVYPKRWQEYMIDILEWIHTRPRKPDGRIPGPSDGEDRA